jgi:GDP-4-dehydro-6-deoxy-D-mannose reductase
MKLRKYLITGFSGFVARHFLDFLEKNERNISVVGVDISPPKFKFDHYNHITCNFKIINLIDSEQVRDLIEVVRPDAIVHLASFSSVAYSWKEPSLSFKNNTNIFLNIIEQVSKLSRPCRILSVGSSEEYGHVLDKDLPISEDHPLMPSSPYAVARVAQELLSRVYVDSFKLDIILTRSFNHIGPGQDERFVVPSFIKKIKESKNTNKSILTGDVSLVRDFVDVRDVVSAYYHLLQNGKSGEVYNICSGKGVSLLEIIQEISGILDIEVQHEVDPNLIRPSDTKKIIGSYEKINQETKWQPTFKLKDTLIDMINFEAES